MGDVFKERGKAFESKYKHDQEMLFKITVRRNRLLGLWAAKQFGLADQDAETYAKEVIVSDFEEPGDEDVIRKVLGDFNEKGVNIDEKALRKQMDILDEIARLQITKDAG